MNKRIADLAGRVLAGDNLSAQDATSLVQISDEQIQDLFYWANRIRLHFVGPDIRCCTIVPSKVGQCQQNCSFCSQSSHYKTHVKGTTLLETEAIVAAARKAASQGGTCFGLVNSGLGPTDSEIEIFGEAMQQIRRDVPVDLCASLGVLTDAQAQELARLGVQKYNHNLQTSRRFFPQICTTHTYDQRIETIRALRRAGISACCGALFGMGETWADRIDLALQLRELAVDTVPLNFLIPIPGTPLEHEQRLTAMECLKIIAVYRFLLPRQSLMVCGGRQVHLRDVQSWIFLAGASGFLIGHYLTTSGRSTAQDQQMLADLGISTAGAGESCHGANPMDDQVVRNVPVNDA